MSEPYNVSDRI